MSGEDLGRSRFDSLLDTEHLQTGFKKRAIRGAGFTISAQTLNFAIQTVGTIILARLLRPEDFGLVTMVSAFSLIVQNFGLNGFTEAVVQRRAISHDQMSKLFWTNLRIMLLLTLAFMLVSPVLVWFYKESELRKIAIVMSLSILSGGLSTCHHALLVRNMEFRLISLGTVLASILSTAIAIVAAIRGFGYWAIVLRQIAYPLLTAASRWIFCPWRPGIPSKETDIRSILKFGLHTYGNFLMDYLRKNSDKMIIGRLFGRGSLGHYDRATNLSSLLPNQLSSALSGVGVATLSRLRENPHKYLDYYAKSLSIQAFFAFPGSVVLTLLGKDIILLLLGSQWDKAGDFLVALGPAMGLVVIYDTNIWLHLSLGRPDRLLKWSTFVLLVALVAFQIGRLFGPMGVAYAYSALFYILLLPALYYAGRPLNIKITYFLSILWKYWFSAFLGGAICWITLLLAKPMFLFIHELAPLFRISIEFFFYTAVYLMIIIVMFRGPKPLLFLIATVKEVVRR
jgi:O-antigen/teichoic acid export membrane protein